MAQLKKLFERIVLVIVTISILITFCATPSSYAKLELGEGEFYYSGTTKGSYVPSTNIFSWLVDNLANIADWLLGIITMGFRMVFVGWTALIEKMLTWALETTSGVNADGHAVVTTTENENGKLEISSTDLTSVHDATNNVTVQAIVFNHVPALDVDFFNFKIDKRYSATGARLYCDKCHEFCDICCGSSTDKCGCECNSCPQCKKYMEHMSDTGKPIVEVLHDAVRQWFYVIEVLSLAALLLVLIFIGIKGTITSIASEKAVYKRMFVDWVVGIIIVFSIPAIMWLILHFNAEMVKIVQKGMETITEVNMKQLNENTDSSGTGKALTYSSQQLEIDVYEAVRTRAYDAKLSVGLSGMIMYMTLVYFAIRYTLIYLKRFFTVMVLTIMGPAVGAGYAMQKALHGKAPSFKNWLSEYFMNVFIQTIHAIIYGVFIASALVFSLQSIGGMALALILMNYSLKAEKTFRKIFKFGSSNSLADSTAGAGDPEKIKGDFQNLRNTAGVVMGGGVVGKALYNTPYAKALKGVAKGAGSVAALGVTAAYNRFFKNTDVDNESTEVDESNDVTYNETDDLHTLSAQADAKAEEAGFNANTTAADVAPDSTKLLNAKGMDAVAKEFMDSLVAFNENPTQDNAIKYQKARNNYDKVRALQAPAFKKQIGSTMDRLFNVTNVIQYNSGYGTTRGVRGRGLNVPKKEENQNYKQPGKLSGMKHMGNMLFGKTDFNPKTGKFEQVQEGLYANMFPQRWLGIDKDDWKQMKQELIFPALKGFGGMASVFGGFGLMVAHPTIGLGMIAGGGIAAHRMLHRPAKSKKYTGRFTNARFSAPTANRIAYEALKREKREMDALVVKNVSEKHPELVNKINANELKVSSLNLELKGMKLNPDLRGINGMDEYMGTKLSFRQKLGKRGQIATTRIANMGNRIKFSGYVAGNRAVKGWRRFKTDLGVKSDYKSDKTIAKHAIKEAKFKAKTGGLKNTGLGYGLEKITIEAKKKEKESREKFYQDALNYQAAVVMGNIAEQSTKAIGAMQERELEQFGDINEAVDKFNEQLLGKLNLKLDKNTGSFSFATPTGEAITMEALFGGEKAAKDAGMTQDKMNGLNQELQKALVMLKINGQLGEFFDNDGRIKKDKQKALFALIENTIGLQSEDTKILLADMDKNTRNKLFGIIGEHATNAQNAFRNDGVGTASQEVLNDAIKAVFGADSSDTENDKRKKDMENLISAAKLHLGLRSDEPITAEDIVKFSSTLKKKDESKNVFIVKIKDKDGKDKEVEVTIPDFMRSKETLKDEETLKQLSFLIVAVNNIQKHEKNAGVAKPTDNTAAFDAGASTGMEEQRLDSSLLFTEHAVTERDVGTRTRRRAQKLKDIMENGILVEGVAKDGKVGVGNMYLVTDLGEIAEEMKKSKGKVRIARATSAKDSEGKTLKSKVLELDNAEFVDFSSEFKKLGSTSDSDGGNGGTSDDSNAILQVLLAQRELDAINEVAKTELKVKGNSAHNSAKKQASLDRTAQYREQLQLNQDVELASRIRKIQGRDSDAASTRLADNPETADAVTLVVEDERKQSPTLGEALKILEERGARSIEDAAKHEAASKVAERSMAFHGPLVDSGSTLEDTFDSIYRDMGIAEKRTKEEQAPYIPKPSKEKMKAYERSMKQSFSNYISEKTVSKKIKALEQEVKDAPGKKKELDKANEKTLAKKKKADERTVEEMDRLREQYGLPKDSFTEDTSGTDKPSSDTNGNSSADNVSAPPSGEDTGSAPKEPEKASVGWRDVLMASREAEKKAIDRRVEAIGTRKDSTGEIGELQAHTVKRENKMTRRGTEIETVTGPSKEKMKEKKGSLREFMDGAAAEAKQRTSDFKEALDARGVESAKEFKEAKRTVRQRTTSHNSEDVISQINKKSPSGGDQGQTKKKK